MAITLADFTKIWASTSPLTPYSFSESNYKEGWNFIGGTPPSRQMWDSIQNQNDEKLKYIVDNFLPLSGGTMTGDIILADGGNPLSTAGGTMTGNLNFEADLSINATADNQGIGINGGTARDKGGWMFVWGKDHATYPGWFSLHANNGTNDSAFVGRPDGTLIWNNKPVMIKGVENGHGIQTGAVTGITVNANSYTQGSVTFSTPFGGTPVVTATYSRGYTEVYVSIYSISRTGFSYTLTNENNDQETGQTIDWIAIY